MPAVQAFLAAFVIMDGDEPGTPEWWPESPWAGQLPIMPTFQPAPSSQLVSNTVQDIFQAAKENALEIIQFVSGETNNRIKFQFVSGELITVTLTERLCTLSSIRICRKDPRLQFNEVQLFIPGTPEPLPSKLDLRTLLPDHPVLEVVLFNNSFGLGPDA